MMNALLMKVHHLIKDGFVHIFTGTFLNKAITMLSSIAIARLVDKSQYAYLSYADTIYGYVMLLTGVGMTSAILKVCAGNTDVNQDKAYLMYSVKCGMVFEILLCSIVVAASMFMVLPFEESRHFIIIYGLYPVLYFFYDITLGYLRAKKYNKYYAGMNLLYSALTCVSSIGFVLLFDAIGIIYARYFVLIAITIPCCYKVRNLFANTDGGEIPFHQKKSLWIMALNIMIANVFSGMMPYNESLLIGNIISDENTLANFRIAGLFPQMVLLITQAVNIYFFPIVAGMDNEGKSTKEYVKKIGFLNFCFIFCAIFVGILFTPWLIPFVYGEKYTDAVSIANLLWIMRGLNAGIRMVPMNMLLAIKEYKFNLVMSVTSFILQLGLDWFFIVQKGIVGVAYGTILVYLITGILYWVYFLKKAK